jgi:hypothetical protein
MFSSRSNERFLLAKLLTLVTPLAIVASYATGACSRNDAEGASASASSSSSTSSSSSSSVGTPTGRTSSCDRVTNMSVCSEYYGAYLAQNEAVLGSACAKLSGAFVGAECPNTAVLGSCVLATGEVRKFYASGGASYDVSRAEKECTGPYKGKWTTLR